MIAPFEVFAYAVIVVVLLAGLWVVVNNALSTAPDRVVVEPPTVPIRMSGGPR